MTLRRDYKAIVLGASTGGMKLVSKIVSALPRDFCIPILIVQHIHDSADDAWANLLDGRSQVRVKEADEKELIRKGTVYLAPANYHLLLEPDLTLTLTVDERVNYARPSVDVLFETAAESVGEHLIGILCTGANTDGANGLRRIKDRGGLTIVQDPKTAEVSSMPAAGIEKADPEYILSPDGILNLLIKIHTNQLPDNELEN